MEKNQHIESEVEEALQALGNTLPVECSPYFNSQLEARIIKAEHSRRASIMMTTVAFGLLLGLSVMNFWGMQKQQPEQTLSQTNYSKKGVDFITQEYFSNTINIGNRISIQ